MARWDARQIQVACFSSNLEGKEASAIFRDLTGDKPSGTQTMQMQGPLGPIPFEQAQGEWHGLSVTVQIQGSRLDFVFQPNAVNQPSKIPLIENVSDVLDQAHDRIAPLIPSLPNLNRIGLVAVLTKIVSSSQQADDTIIDELNFQETFFAKSSDLFFRANKKSVERGIVLNRTFTWQVETFQNLFITHPFGPALTQGVSEPTFAASLSLDFNTVVQTDPRISIPGQHLLSVFVKDMKSAWETGKPIGGYNADAID